MDSVGQKRTHESPTDETPLTKRTEMRLPMKVDIPAGMKRDMRSLIQEDSFWEASPSAAADRTKRSREMISMIIAVIIPCEEEEEKQQEYPPEEDEVSPDTLLQAQWEEL